VKISKSAIFIFELMVVVFVFTACAAVCVSIFANSYNMSNRSEDLTNAMLRAESYAEKIKAAPDDMDGTMYYDEEWKLSDEEESRYSMQVRGNVGGVGADALYEYDIKVYKKGTEDAIYELGVATYRNLKAVS
jgi:Tfp pilus assembly protein PilE